MNGDKLGIYLNDHLAGATFGIGLAQRIAHQHRHSARSADLQRICDEIAQDRQSLLDVMDAQDVPARRYKVSGGWVAERLGRLKPNGVLYRRSGLSTLIELEALRLGVEGKALIWRTLLVVAAGSPGWMKRSSIICWTGRGARSTHWRRCASRQRRRSSRRGRAV
ncbi:hypothetical protein AB0D83_13965 [Streptomyces decoyicus]|uniref:hypothetical protein n=1 Tax=Streptomyces decoyicus TaxID=249567 RepID=UPI0033EE05B9